MAGHVGSKIIQINTDLYPPGETRGIHVNSASFLFKIRGDLAEFTWFVRWVKIRLPGLSLMSIKKIFADLCESI